MRYAGIEERVEAVVVGGGPAGLAASRALAARGVQHVVLEAGRVGESWRSQRWDSFRLNTPRFMSRPFVADAGAAGAEGFAGHDEVVGRLDELVRAEGLPVRGGTRVLSAAPRPRGGWVVRTAAGSLLTPAVVAASGFQRAPRVPALADEVPEGVLQLHSSDYRRPGALPDGAVLVVGSGQSGTQIAEDLLGAGRRTYLATSRVGRLPRRHRGRDVEEWLVGLGTLDERPDEVDPAELRATMPQISGTRGGRTLALQQLAREGVTLLGGIGAVEGRRLVLGDDLPANMAAGDEAAARARQRIDEAIARAGIAAPPAEPDPAEAPEPGIGRGPRAVDLRAAGIAAIVWATGLGPDLGWLRDGAAPGLHLLGAPWLRRRGSGILWGMPGDAEAMAAAVAAGGLSAAA